MFARSTLAARPFVAAPWRALGAAALRTTLPAVRPALSASLHVSARAPLQATKVASVDEGAAAAPGSEAPEPKNIHEHPRIWEDVNYETLGQLLNPVEGGEGPRIDTKVVLLDFYADWCGPCKSLSPLLQNLAKDDALDTTLISLDVDKNPEIAQAFQITALPTVYGIYQNKPVRRFQGLLPEDSLREFVQALPTLAAEDAKAEAAAAAAQAKDNAEEQK